MLLSGKQQLSSYQLLAGVTLQEIHRILRNDDPVKDVDGLFGAHHQGRSNPRQKPVQL
jgi:hypothetical protein